MNERRDERPEPTGKRVAATGNDKIVLAEEALERPRVRPADTHGLGHRPLPPLSLYVHVPWCVRKCPYCDFNSHQAGREIPEQAYLAALQADLEQALPLVWGRQVISIFIGGGTPSLLSGKAVDTMLASLRACLNVLPDAEITLEANPGTAEAARFQSYADSGVNRISLGIQSFDDEALRALGRIHDAAQARAAIEMAQRAFERVNLDVMYALPGQTLDALRQDLNTAMAFGTGHLSVYHLTLEPNTVFAKYPPALPDEDLAARMHEHIIDATARGGWEQYEVSAYARTGQRSIHNQNYWTFGDYLGIGPGAHGKLSFHDRILRQARNRMPESWMKHCMQRDGSHIAEDRVVPPSDLPFEFMLNALRLKEGVDTALFSAHTGLPITVVLPQLRKLEARGLLDLGAGRMRATARGWTYLNDVLHEFVD